MSEAPPDRDAEVQALLDKQAITEVLHRYCRGVDRADADLLRSVYWPDAYDDHGMFRGNAYEFVEMLAADPAESPYRVIQHAVTNLIIEVDGDTATVESYFTATHRREDDTGAWDEIIRGRYLDRIERRDREWRIAHRVAVWDWSRTEPATEKWWDGRDGEFVLGSRGPGDPVYSLSLDT